MTASDTDQRLYVFLYVCVVSAQKLKNCRSETDAGYLYRLEIT